MKKVIFFMAFCGLVSSGLHRLASSPATQIQPSPLEKMLLFHPPQITEWQWVKQPWKGNSASYIRINRRISAAFANKSRIEAVTQEYRKIAEDNPTDPLAVYAWGYAAYAARPLDSPTLGRDIQKIALALSLPQFPDTYEYARLRFVTTANWRPYLQLKPLGNRLLQRNLKDYYVKQGMIDILAVGPQAERQRALNYAQQLVQQYPKSATSYAELGWVYDLRFGSSKTTSDGDGAIAAYRKAMTLPSTTGGRQRLQHNIHRIQQEQKQLRAKG